MVCVECHASCMHMQRGGLGALKPHVSANPPHTATPHPDGGVLYICGVPGTGKTALVMEVLRGLRPQVAAAGAQVVTINCLQLPSPQHVFSRLWEKLSGQHLGPARCVVAAVAVVAVRGGGGSRMGQSVYDHVCAQVQLG